MKESKGNIFKVACDAVCVTTNGFVKSNGLAVMGRGCAATVAKNFPKVPGKLAQHIGKNGNCVGVIYHNNGIQLVSYPVKPVSTVFDGNNVVRHMTNKFRIGDRVPGWAAVAEMGIIERSARELVALTDEMGWKEVILPRPGCGAGELSWEQVRPVLADLLDDRFTCMTF